MLQNNWRANFVQLYNLDRLSYSYQFLKLLAASHIFQENSRFQVRPGKPNQIGFVGYFYLLSRRSRYWAITSNSALPESVGASVT